MSQNTQDCSDRTQHLHNKILTDQLNCEMWCKLFHKFDCWFKCDVVMYPDSCPSCNKCWLLTRFLPGPAGLLGEEHAHLDPGASRLARGRWQGNASKHYSGLIDINVYPLPGGETCRIVAFLCQQYRSLQQVHRILNRTRSPEAFGQVTFHFQVLRYIMLRENEAFCGKW